MAPSLMRRFLLVLMLQSLLAGQALAQGAGEASESTEASETADDRLSQVVETNPLDPENVLRDIVPQPGALIPYGIPKGWFDFKSDQSSDR